MNTLARSNVNTKPLFERLVCDEGLHYCCVYAFFVRHKQTSLICLRLGVGPRTVQRHKAMFREGGYKCQHEPRCMEVRGMLKK